MTENCISSNLEDTGFFYTMTLIQGKYKLFILYTLAERETVRFNEMQLLSVLHCLFLSAFSVPHLEPSVLLFLR